MNGRKIAAIALVLIVAVALAPLVIYGPTVNVAAVSIGVSITSGPLSTKSSDYYAIQTPIFSVALDYTTVDVTALNAYQYLATQLTGPTSFYEEGDPAGAVVEITITFELTTPSDQSLVFTLNPISGQGVGAKEIQVMLGPEAGIRGHGEFHLSITIAVAVTPPGFTEPVANLSLEPINRTFTIP